MLKRFVLAENQKTVHINMSHVVSIITREDVWIIYTVNNAHYVVEVPEKSFLTRETK